MLRDVHPIPPFGEQRGRGGGSRRVFKQFVWLEVGSVKMVLSRPAQLPLTQAVGQLKGDQVNKVFLISLFLLMISVVACTPQNSLLTATSLPVASSPTVTLVLEHPDQTPACFLPIPPWDVIVQPTPFPKDVTIIENEGSICFVPLSEYAFDVQVSSSGCYSSGCTLIFERTGNIEIDQDAFTIQFNSRYAIKEVGNVRDSGESCECAADCGGAGYLHFKTNELQDGIYSIKLGETQIGELAVPFHSNDICWSTEAIATAYP
jgi:hypothetical protein